MNGFKTGLIAGGLIGILGLSMAMSDRKTRRVIIKDGKAMRHGADKLFDKFM